MEALLYGLAAIVSVDSLPMSIIGWFGKNGTNCFLTQMVPNPGPPPP